MKYENFEIITEGYPREMIVWDDEQEKYRALVMCKIPSDLYPYCTINEYKEYDRYANAKEIEEQTPPKDEFPKVMMVSDQPITKHNNGKKRVVFCHNPILSSPYLTYDFTEAIDEVQQAETWSSWKYAKDIPEKVELTFEQIAEKFGLDIEQVEIKFPLQ